MELALFPQYVGRGLSSRSPHNRIAQQAISRPGQMISAISFGSTQCTREEGRTEGSVPDTRAGELDEISLRIADLRAQGEGGA